MNNFYQNLRQFANKNLDIFHKYRGFALDTVTLKLAVLNAIDDGLGVNLDEENTVMCIDYILQFCDNQYDFFEIIKRTMLDKQGNITLPNINLAIENIRCNRANRFGYFMTKTPSRDGVISIRAQDFIDHQNNIRTAAMIQCAVVCINQELNKLKVSNLYLKNIH